MLVADFQPQSSVSLESSENCNRPNFFSTTSVNSTCAEKSSEQNGNEEFGNLDVATLLSLNSGVESDDEEDSAELRRPKGQDSETEEEDDDDNHSTSAESTSCSENSFEMSSATSFASTLNKADQRGANHGPFLAPPTSLNVQTSQMPSKPSYSQSMDSFLVVKPLSPQAKEQISRELSGLDTGLPELDFKSLEEKLSTAAKEHEESERRKLGDEVRRRLALQYDQYTSGPSPAVNTRPLKSNLAQRLNASKNLQVCYMNELAEADEDSDDEFLPVASSSFVPKSKSTPNLSGRKGMDASELARRRHPDAVGFHDRLTILREETQLMLEQAKKAAKLQMEVEKQNEEISEKTTSKRLSRLQLSKMPISQLKTVLEQFKTKIDVANADLVQFLMEKDALYMAQDSMLVDIEDTIQHTIDSTTLDLPPFLYIADPSSPPASAPPTSRAPTKLPTKSPSKSSLSSLSAGIFSSTRWKIFKR